MTTSTVRFVLAFSLLSQVMSQRTLGSTTDSLVSDLAEFCDEQEKAAMETEISVSDSTMRFNNKCMCGFLKTPHVVLPESAAAKTALVGDNGIVAAMTFCLNGFASVADGESYPCKNVDLLAHMSNQRVNGAVEPNGIMNDLWGWTDEVTGREYALVGTLSGTVFVDVTTPETPISLGKLVSHENVTTLWRDIKTYGNYAYVVAETDNHGMQVFDLTRLRGLSEDPDLIFEADLHYAGFGNAHNIAINEQSGFAYAVGTRACAGGGMHIMNITDPLSPSFVGCFSQGYVHDVQCVIYSGVDSQHNGKEICFASMANQVKIVDVTDKSNMIVLSSTSYEDSNKTYTHQGWLTLDQRYFVFGDETDEIELKVRTRTHVLNVQNLSDPVMADRYDARTDAIDHNQYINGNFVYQANYRAGLRILEMTGASLNEVGYFDIWPTDDAATFNGAWSTYPFFSSGIVIVSGIEQGLFVLKPTVGPQNPPPSGPNCSGITGASECGSQNGKCIWKRIWCQNTDSSDLSTVPCEELMHMQACDSQWLRCQGEYSLGEFSCFTKSP